MQITLVNADLPSVSPVPPLGLVSLANAATKSGHKVTIRDYQLAPVEGSRNPGSFASFCKTSDEVLGISTSSLALPLVIKTVQRLKAKRPELITILGGIGAAGVAKQIISEFPWIDYVCIGEGENVLSTLLESLEAKKTTYKIDGIVYTNSRSLRIKNLDTIQTFASDYIDLNQYRLINVATARGCPYPCTFCDVAPYWQHRCTVRSIESVINEIKMIQRKLVEQPTIVFVDDTLTVDKLRVKVLCKKIIKLEPSIRWACYCRVDTLDEGLLKMMAESGCHKIYLGLESGSDKILNRIKKGITSDLSQRIALLAKQYIPIVQTSFVWGYPFETWDDFYETLLLMAFLTSYGISVKANILTPLAFSKIFSEYEELLCFEPEYSSQLHLAGYHSSPELLKLIRKYPQVFQYFYMYYSENLTDKYDLLREMGMSPEHIWDIWEIVKGTVPLREKNA